MSCSLIAIIMFLPLFPLQDTEPHEGVFYEAVNVQVDEPVHHWQVGDHTVADIYCIKCDDRLGWKYIQVGGEQITVQNGNVKTIMQKLLRRQGNQILDAVTMDPVPENP
ncbi:hypothetical protein Pfo_007096 [Paulownia fortunei]|nr:hypothetical protein Pfo_007096 [Paulownia fortunei]